MATLDDLRVAILPGSRWIANAPDPLASGRAPERPPALAWVRLMRARVPAFDALEPGDVAVVPLSAVAVVAAADDGIGSLVAAAAAAGVAGLVVVADPTAEASAATIERIRVAAERAGVAVLDAGAGDATAIERSAIGFLVNERAELERQATLLESRLQQIALAGGGIEPMAAAIAGFLHRAVAIEGRRGAALVVHAPPDAPGAPSAAAAYHDRPRSAGTRIALPIPGEGPAANAPGALVLLGDGPPTELERVATARVAGVLALELARDEAVRAAAESGRREPLPADGPPWVVIVARQSAAGDDSVADADARETLRRDIRGLAPARRMTLRGDALSVELRIVAAAPADDPDGLRLGHRIAALLARTVAVSRVFTEASGRSAAEADARSTLEAAERLASPPAVARADRLPAYRLLGNLHNLPDGARQARALLEPLLGGRTVVRADVRAEWLATLRAVLDEPGLGEAARALGVHRNTVAYRVRRIEAITGWRLADPELRFPLALALRLVQEEQA